MNKSDILNFIQSSAYPVKKQEIATHLRIKGEQARVELKRALKELTKEGAIMRHKGATYSVPDGLPAVLVIEVSDIDIDGDLFGKPVEIQTDARIEIKPDKKGHPTLAPGDRILARLTRVDQNTYEARTIRRMDDVRNRITGLLRVTKRGAILQPADKKARMVYNVSDKGAAQDGDLVVGEIQPGSGFQKQVRIVEVLGAQDDPKAISLISLNEMGLREDFPKAVIEETKGMTVPELKAREDLRSIPLITIDGADARDFDDAVFAEKSGNGYHMIVAIADVAHYVRPGSALDREAQRRGNSTYFPDRVVPMLPEALSNDLCSLRPNEDRACLAVHMWINESGELERHKFVRGLMRSKARMTYEQVQFQFDRQEGEQLALLKPLYEVFSVLDKARRKRNALELDLPERQILIDAKGNMTGVKKRDRYDSHKLIEEFMVLANVAAATALEAKKAVCVYRIHDKPSTEKLDSAREFIQTFGLTLSKGQVNSPMEINMILLKAKELEYSHLISQVILRSQAQAVYSPDNIGHFGLALKKYAHFTSPIRRYADLLVHRSLIAAYGLGEGPLTDEEKVKIEQICEHISATERVSMEAERNAVDRFTAAFLSERIGAQFSGKISGVTRFGLFINLDESGADGLVPMRSLPDDFYVHDEQAHALVGKRTGKVYRLGARVQVRLMEADGLTGSTLLEMAGESVNGADIPGMAMPRSFQGKPSHGKKSYHDKHKRDRDGGGYKKKNKFKGGGKGGKKRR